MLVPLTAQTDVILPAKHTKTPSPQVEYVHQVGCGPHMAEL